MNKHPNEFTRRLIHNYFDKRKLEVVVNAVDQGYVIFFRHFSATEACNINDPSGRLLYDDFQDLWRLYWMSGHLRWHLYDRYPQISPALDEMLSEHAGDLFRKVL
ncbi:MAG: DUF3024 domain-containing protein [Desulfuromonadales bacterium]